MRRQLFDSRRQVQRHKEAGIKASARRDRRHFSHSEKGIHRVGNVHPRRPRIHFASSGTRDSSSLPETAQRDVTEKGRIHL